MDQYGKWFTNEKDYIVFHFEYICAILTKNVPIIDSVKKKIKERNDCNLPRDFLVKFNEKYTFETVKIN